MEFIPKLVSIDAKADVAAMLIAGRLTPSVASFLQHQAQGLAITSFAQTEDLWASILVSKYSTSQHDYVRQNQFLLVSRDLDELWSADSTALQLTSLAPSSQLCVTDTVIAGGTRM